MLEAPDRETVWRIVEGATVEVVLSALAVLADVHRMDIHPEVSSGRVLHANGKPVRLRHVAEGRESLPARRQRVGVYGQIQIPMRSRLAACQGSHPPAAGHPVTHSVRLQRVENPYDVSELHAEPVS